jgi:hypothetical protein
MDKGFMGLLCMSGKTCRVEKPGVGWITLGGELLSECGMLKDYCGLC